MAISDFNRALLRHTSIDAIELVVASHSTERAREFVDAETAGGRGRASHPRITVRPVIGGSTAMGAPDVWHDISGDVIRPFRLRDLSAASERWYPISVTHHTVSYQRMVHGFFVPLVLDMTSNDVLVCTSRSARAAIADILSHVAMQIGLRLSQTIPFAGRLEIIPLGVDTEVFRPRDRADARAQLGLPGDSVILLWNGRLSFLDKADLLPLVRVLRDLAQGHADAHVQLVVAGADRPAEGARAAIQQYARQLGIGQAVRILGDTDPRLRCQLYAAADIFVSPVDNVQETFGLTPIEAMASGLPQVVSDWDGYRDTVVHGETGFRVPTYVAASAGDADALYALADSSMTDHLAVSQAVAVDPGGLRHCLEQLIERPDLRARMSEASRRRALAHFDWRHVIKQYEALWADMAARPGARPATSARWYLPHACSALHYATRALDGATTIRLTSAGHGVVRGSELLPEWPLRRAVIDVAIERCALQCLAAHEPLPVQELVDGLCTERTVSPHIAMRHVLWLMKYGFVEAATVPQSVFADADDAARSWRWAGPTAVSGGAEVEATR